MVVADQGNWLADVVFVIEGTANLSPYIDSIKANYVVPTLEYFNGGPVDDRDCGCDYNSTMYALVVFMAADCAPETAATCSTPTTNIHKFLSLLDKIQFIGGAGESHSHIAEGLSTALQAFDDFQALRETNSVTQKHCILICNSPPYPIPALESSVYSLLMPEQLASVMSERQVSFSIFSPRKIPTLFKLYEKAGGDLQLALTKNYAKDRRHLVLLRGFQLQERPMSPPSIESKTAAATSATNSVCSPPTQGQKRPATNSPPNPRELTGFKQPNNYSGGGSGGGLDWPAENSVSQISLQSSMPGAGGPTQTLTYAQPGLPGQLNVRPGIPTPPGSHMGTLNQPNAPNVTITNKAQPSQLSNQHMDNVRPQRGHSPVTVGPRMSWNQPAVPSPPASTPPTTSVLATQLSMAPSNVRHPQTVTLQSLSQSQTIIPSQILSSSGGSLRPNMSGVGLRMTTASSGSIPSVSSTSNNLASQLGQHSSFGPPSSQPSQQPSQLPTQGMTSNMQSKLGSGPAMNPMISSQGPSLTSAPTSSNMPPQGMQSNIGSMSMNNSLSGPQSSSQSVPPQQAMKDRRSIWAGIIEFQEKSAPQQAQRVSHSLSCTFSCTVTNGEPEVNADKWPNRLALQLLPKQLVMNANLFAVLKTAARHVLIHFNQESDALQKLCKIMSTSWVGCIQFSAPCDIRIMLVVYMADKRIYMGFIAHDQDAFFNAVRAMYDNHRKQMQQQQQKQRLQQLSGNPNPTSEGMGLPSSTTSTQGIIMSQQPAIANISGNNPMGPRMPLGQEQVSRNVSQLPPPPVPAPSSGIVHSTTMNQPQQQQQQQQQQQPVNQQQQTNNARISQLEAARQQNLLKIQQLQQTLEAAQQKEVQFKIAQEQQQQQQQQHQQQQQQQVVIRQLQQQLQQQQQQLQQHQQRIQMQQVSQGSHNPQLRHLLQQQVQQQIRQQQHQMLMQHPQNIRAQLSNNMPSGQPPQSQQQSQPPQQSWGDAGLLDLLPP